APGGLLGGASSRPTAARAVLRGGPAAQCRAHGRRPGGPGQRRAPRGRRLSGRAPPRDAGCGPAGAVLPGAAAAGGRRGDRAWAADHSSAEAAGRFASAWAPSECGPHHALHAADLAAQVAVVAVQARGQLVLRLIAVLSCTPLWPGKWQSKVMTVACILLAQALKDLFEDQKRRRDDRLENSRPLHRFDPGSMVFQQASWQECSVGDLVLVFKGESVPADLLAVASSEEQGLLYVSTKSLDGETNLKQRRIPPPLLPPTEASAESGAEEASKRVLESKIEVSLESPHASLLSMDCACSVAGRECGLCVDHFAMRGCELQNTRWLVGVACYVGNDTKVRLNSFPPPAKTSELESYLNYIVVTILTCVLALCLYFSVASQLWEVEGREPLPFLEVFVMYMIIMYPVMPMTLYIMFEVMHLAIGRQIETDPLMCDAATASHALARNTSVVEQLGQVDFLFSDKTGTLTTNEMRFAHCCIGGSVFGSFLPVEGDGEPKGVEQLRRLLAGEAQEGTAEPHLRAFFQLLAVCSTVQVDADGLYQGESPDEVALATAARAAGFGLLSRRAQGTGSIVRVRRADGLEEELSVAHVLAFTSDRKRMSVVCPTGAGGAVVLSKGADAIMCGLLREPAPAAALAALESFSRAGLRTLVVARREMSAPEYARWRATWDTASAAMQGRASMIADVSAAAEQGLTYLGVTALEDRLQDGVPDTIAALGRAGIRTWVLTGDKVETAVEIARSCRLFDGDIDLVRVVGAASGQECQALLERPAGGRPGRPSKQGLVLDGVSLQYILHDVRLRQLLYQVGERCCSCVCCRLSPLQKRELVHMVRSENPRAITLSIGDGANDVPMIQGAHVGVGIRGKEGSAAVQASDMAVSQFRFLGNLVFCHGRRSYRRLSMFLCFFLYKSMAIAVGYIVHAQATLFSGDLAYAEWLDVIYNPATSLGAVLVLCLDLDVPDEVALRSPELYALGPKRACLNARVIFAWTAQATFHGFVAWCAPMYVVSSSDDADLRTDAFWKASLLAFTAVIFVVHLQLAFATRQTITRLGMLLTAIEVIGYVMMLFALGSPLGRKAEPELQGLPAKVFSSREHLLCLSIQLAVLALLMPAFDWLLASCVSEGCGGATRGVGTSIHPSCNYRDVLSEVSSLSASCSVSSSASCSD
ncbi:unnamed protein product, partial [Prorocentrum cordatum]